MFIDWSWTTWLVSVGAVVISGAIAWFEGNWKRHSSLDMGFVNHGGMWGDFILLPIANATIVPHLQIGPWILAAAAACALLSFWVHVHWYRGDPPSHRRDGIEATAGLRSRIHSREHMWPSRPHGSWWRDLSWSGWAHIGYVMGELSLLIGFLLFPMPDEVIAIVALIFTLHVPLGLLQPRWFLTGKIATVRQQPLLVPLMITLWAVAFVKFMD